MPGAEYVLVRDAYVALRKLRSMPGLGGVLPGAARDSRFKFRQSRLHPVDLYHTFNQVCFGDRPWVATFETTLPRYLETVARHGSDLERASADPDLRRAVRAIAAPNCGRILALSRCAAERQAAFAAHFPEWEESLSAKTTVLHPPQEIRELGEDRTAPGGDEPIRFALVGHDFFRKGGAEVLTAMERVRTSTGANLHLTVVSLLNHGDYATGATDEDAARTRAFLQANADWIQHEPELPPDEVERLMERSHVGLLPTYADTYGYSVLELQSKGCPVVTTDVRALPEINDDSVGWVIPIPKEPDGEAAFARSGGVEAISKALTRGLESVFSEIAADPAGVRSKGERARQRVREHHDPGQYGERLGEIYRECLG